MRVTEVKEVAVASRFKVPEPPLKVTVEVPEEPPLWVMVLLTVRLPPVPMVKVAPFCTVMDVTASVSETETGAVAAIAAVSLAPGTPLGLQVLEEFQLPPLPVLV